MLVLPEYKGLVFSVRFKLRIRGPFRVNYLYLISGSAILSKDVDLWASGQNDFEGSSRGLRPKTGTVAHNWLRMTWLTYLTKGT